MPPGSSPPGAVVFVTDAKRVSAFYQAVAGLPIVLAEEGYAILESAATQLVIHALPAPIAAGAAT